MQCVQIWNFIYFLRIDRLLINVHSIWLCFLHELGFFCDSNCKIYFHTFLFVYIFNQIRVHSISRFNGKRLCESLIKAKKTCTKYSTACNYPCGSVEMCNFPEFYFTKWYIKLSRYRCILLLYVYLNRMCIRMPHLKKGSTEYIVRWKYRSFLLHPVKYKTFVLHL